MQKTLKQLKLTFTSLSLLILLCVSFVLLLAQIASAQDTEIETSAPTLVPLETREVRQAERLETRATTQIEREENQALRQEQFETMSSTRDAVIAERRSALEERKAEAETRRTEFASQMEARKTELEAKRVEIQARREERVATLQVQAQERIINLAENATARLTAIIIKLGEFADRLRERAGELEARGIDTTDVIAALDSAERILTQASNALDSVDIDVEYAVTSDQPQTDWADARAQFTEIRDLIKEAHALLREAVAALKAAVAEDETERGVSAAVQREPEPVLGTPGETESTSSEPNI